MVQEFTNVTTRKWLRNDATTLIFRLLILYVAWFLCRVTFYFVNSDLLGTFTWAELPGLFRGATAFDTVSIIYANALFILLSLVPFRFRERRAYQTMLFWIYAVINSVALMANLSDSIYFHYVKKRFSADELTYLENNDNNLSVAGQSLLENWYMVLFLGVLLAGVLWCYKRFRYEPTHIQGRWRYLVVNTFVFLVGITLSIGGVRGGFGTSRPLMPSNATLYTASNFKASLILSNPFCVLRSIGKTVQIKSNYFKPEELVEIYTPEHYPLKTPRLESAPTLGKRNVVIFVLESFSSEHSAQLNPDLYPDGVGFTPYLDSLMRAGYYFRHTFASGQKSIDALPSVLTSIPSYLTPFVLLPQSIAETRGLPVMLGEMGYTSAFFNGSTYGSMGFGAYTNMVGVDRYYSMDDYEESVGTNDYDGTWGIWDAPFLQYMAQTLAQTPQPFLASVFTLTSHHPFKVPASAEGLPAGETKIHKPVGYVDQSIRAFMQTASREPWFNNSIFVFVGDHVSSETFAPKTATSIGATEIFGLIYTPDGALQGVEQTPVSQLDIMPTILGLVGNETPYLAFGRDLFAVSTRRPMAVNMYSGNFHAITDSLSVQFDGKEVVAVYHRTDTLERRNLVHEKDASLWLLERELKARLQQYYQHVEKSRFIVED